MVARKKKVENLTPHQQIAETNAKVEEAARVEKVDPSLFTTSTGAQIRVKVIPSHMYERLWRAYPEIVPPFVHQEDGDQEWEEENLEDPDYIVAADDRTRRVSEALNRLYALKGLEIIELPPGIKSFDEDKEWLEEYSVLGFNIEMPTRAARLIEWTMYRILPDLSDVNEMQRVATRLLGTDTKEDVATEARFQGDGGQDTDRPVD